MNQLENQLLNNIDTGLLFIDDHEQIGYLNQTGKLVTGLIHGSNFSHPSGEIKRGDIVLIADISLGGDDGGMTPEDLGALCIHDPELENGDTIVAISAYKNPDFKAEYRFSRGEHPTGILSVRKKYSGHILSAAADLRKRILTLQFDDEVYELTYLIDFGHIVILDGSTLKVKFVQAKGYSYRQETIRSLLMGKTFLAKTDANEELDVIGKSVEDVFGEGSFLNAVRSILSGKEKCLNDQLFLLHKRQLLCSLKSLNDEGVVVTITDVSNLGELLEKHDKILETIERSLPKLVAPTKQKMTEEFENLQGRSPAMMEVKYLITRAAAHGSTILLTGENGTGKTVVAREIHRLSRSEKPFIEVNCGGIPQTLFESELFGYAPGSFTGALRQGKEGFFQMAQEGTIFLDEITEIPPAVQAKLLHVLQDKRFYPIGASQPITIDARIIAATNKKIRDEILAGAFREDLYYRLNVFPIALPPLRERQEDIYPLCNRMIQSLCERHGLKRKRLSHSAYQRLITYTWPGNVRQLENVLERAVLICESATLYPEHLNLPREETSNLLLSEVRQLAEKSAMQQALLITKDRTELADMLGISMSTLYQKLKEYQLIG